MDSDYTKEDVALDRAHLFEKTILATVDDADGSVGLLTAFRALRHSQGRSLAEPREHANDPGGLFGLLDRTPALQARLAVYREQLTAMLAARIGTLDSTAPKEWCETVAATLLAAHSSLFRLLRQLAAAETDPRESRAIYERRVDELFDRLAAGDY